MASPQVLDESIHNCSHSRGALFHSRVRRSGRGVVGRVECERGGREWEWGWGWGSGTKGEEDEFGEARNSTEIRGCAVCPMHTLHTFVH